MPGDVAEGFLNDSVKRRFVIGRQPLFQTGGPQFAPDAGTLRPRLEKLRQRRQETEIVEQRRPKFPEKQVQLPAHLVNQLAQRLKPIPQVLAPIRGGRQAANFNGQSAKHLSELVMELARDPLTLVFLHDAKQSPAVGTHRCWRAHWLISTALGLPRLAGRAK